METTRQNLPPGWHYDEDTGAIMRDVIHRMGRRCRRWDYCGKGAYMITLTLADRSKPLFGRLVGESSVTTETTTITPAAWPYVPGEKKMTRIDACVLNRIAQWLSGPGAVEIKYQGVEPRQVDRLAREALKAG